MPSDRSRILELALESLIRQRKRLDEEIAEIFRELRGKSRRAAALPSAAGRKRKQPRFSKEERVRRSKRMTAYWDKWRKQNKK